MSDVKIATSDLPAACASLNAGQRILLSGEVFTARDAAHKRICELIDGGKELPFDLRGSVIYFAGPTPAPSGLPIGSCGPTTSSRMDSYSPRLLDLGLAAMIGKGPRSDEVCDAIMRNRAVYFCATGGAGALAAMCVVSAEEIAFRDLGCESVKRLIIRDFPLIVGVDPHGGNIFRK